MMMRKMMLLAGASMVLLLSGCDKQVALPEKESTASAPVAGKWLETTVMTPEGGMMMGNPAAKIKLIEYGALTCSHCADFAKESHDELRGMIAKGTVSYEFRNFLLNAMDVPAAILARCSGPGPFFTIADQMFATQPEWLGEAKNITPTDQSQWESFPPDLLAQVLADKLGLVKFVRDRGIGIEKAKACLSDKVAIEKLGNMTKVAVDEFKVSGTPTFLINGKVVEGVGDWGKLRTVLKEAGA